MRLETKIMNRSEKKAEENETLKIIERGLLLKKDSYSSYELPRNIVDACVDSAKFTDPMSLKSSLNEVKL